MLSCLRTRVWIGCRTPSPEELVARLCEMAAALNAPQKLQRTPAQIEAYFEACRAKMRPNPFHNWNHAFDVAQFMFALLTGTGLDQKLCDAQLLGLFFGAVAHDLDHRGKSNAFEINEKTELAVKFPKSAAPLESHHCALALATMDELELLDGMSADEADLVRSVVRDVIMATDMGHHAEILKDCKAAFKGVENLSSKFFEVSPYGGDEEARLLCQLLIKGCDISNPCRPAVVAERWNALCYEEFYAEGDIDRKKNRKLNPLHDRHNNMICRSSVGFIGFVVTPIFKQLKVFLRNAAKHPDGNGLEPKLATALIAMLDANKAWHQSCLEEQLAMPQESDEAESSNSTPKPEPKGEDAVATTAADTTTRKVEDRGLGSIPTEEAPRPTSSATTKLEVVEAQPELEPEPEPEPTAAVEEPREQ